MKCDSIYKYLFIILSLFFILNCKKKKIVIPTLPVNCNLSANTLIKSDSVFQISSDTSYATLNNTYYCEFAINATKGIGIEFSGNVMASPGTFNITKSFTEILTVGTKVYITYYEDGNNYVAQSGELLLYQNGAEYRIELCKILCKDSFGNEKLISIKVILMP